MSIPGGLSEVELANWPEIETKVKESLADLAGQADGPTLKFGKIISAHKQVVAGVKYHVTVEIIHGDQTKECKLSIWERPWLGERSVDIELEEKAFKVERKGNKQE